MDWYSVRCVFHWAERQTYEERITIWQAGSADAAIERAESDASTYAQDTGMAYLGLAQSYQLFDPPEDGSEVFSLMRGSGLAPEEYVDRFFDTGEERTQ